MPRSTPTLTRRGFIAATAASPLALGPHAAQAQAAPLRIAMSISDVPRLWGGPEAGFEGIRFGALFLYDALVNWDLSSADRPSGLVPGLATSWRVNPEDRRKWVFSLRPGVRFHDGSPFDAEACAWNFASILDPGAPQFDALRAGLVRTRLTSVASWRVIDPMTFEVTTHAPDALFPYQAPFLWMVSPAHWRALGGDWQRFAANPSGTGPYRFVSLRPRERAEFEPNAEYWDKDRIPRVPRTVLLPMPEGTARVAALRAGQVDVVETVPPDTIASLRAAGLRVVMNSYPHVWAWRLSVLPDSPFRDVRVRRAANLAIDRDAIVAMLAGSALPAKGKITPDHPWFGKPAFDLRYDPEMARALMREAGYGPDRRAAISVIIASGGGGQMVPMPMNEALQEMLRAIWLDVTFQVVDFATIINMLRAGARAPTARGAAAINIAIPTMDPTTGWIIYDRDLVPPRGVNWGEYDSPAVQAQLAAARSAFGEEENRAAMARLHEILVEEAAALFVVHDLNPRALAPRVRGFVQARNWFQDYTRISFG